MDPFKYSVHFPRCGNPFDRGNRYFSSSLLFLFNFLRFIFLFRRKHRTIACLKYIFITSFKELFLLLREFY